MSFGVIILATVGDPGQNNETGFDGGPDQWRMDFLASCLDGLVHLPLAFLFVWLLHRFNLNRWLIVTAILATIASIVLPSALHETVWPIYSMTEELWNALGVHRFSYVPFLPLLVCFAGALFFAWRIRRHRADNVEEVFE